MRARRAAELARRSRVLEIDLTRNEVDAVLAARDPRQLELERVQVQTQHLEEALRTQQVISNAAVADVSSHSAATEVHAFIPISDELDRHVRERCHRCIEVTHQDMTRAVRQHQQIAGLCVTPLPRHFENTVPTGNHMNGYAARDSRQV